MIGIQSLYKSINIPKGLFPSPGAKVIIFSTFSVISGPCYRVSVTPGVLSSTLSDISIHLGYLFASNFLTDDLYHN